MDARTMLAMLDGLGVMLVQKEGRPSLRFPPGVSGPLKAELLTAVASNRETVLRHFQGSAAEPRDCEESAGAGEYCGECEGWVFGGTDTGEVSKLCGRLMCPYWRPGVGPEWQADYRNREEWKRRHKR